MESTGTALPRESTGSPVPLGGIWETRDHPHQVDIRLKQGETFPTCRECHAAVIWEFEEA